MDRSAFLKIYLGSLEADRVVAYMDGWRTGADQLQQAIDSLLPQVDELRIAVEDIAAGPVARTGLVVVTRAEAFEAVDPAAPFHQLDDRTIVLYCRPDLLYPPDYALRMVEGLAYADGRAVVGLHGAFVPQPIEARRLSGVNVCFPWWSPLTRSRQVHWLQASLTAMHWRHCQVGVEVVRQDQPKDLELSIACAQAGIPLVCLKRTPGWMTALVSQIEADLLLAIPAHATALAEWNEALEVRPLSIAGRGDGSAGPGRLVVIDMHARRDFEALVAAAVDGGDAVLLVLDRTKPLNPAHTLVNGAAACEVHWLGEVTPMDVRQRYRQWLQTTAFEAVAYQLRPGTDRSEVREIDPIALLDELLAAPSATPPADG